MTAVDGVRLDTTYLSELRTTWRYLAAACLGMASGYMLTLYITSIFVPHLLKDFGWSKAQFSLSGVTLLFGFFCVPIAGRLTDILGLRRIATFGVLATPLIFIAFSTMTGEFSQYLWISIVQNAFVSTTTATTVYGRLIAERFNRTRGLALATMGCAPPLAGAAIAPLLSRFVDAHGWRDGYLAVAAVTAAGGAITLLVLPRTSKEVGRIKSANKPPAGTYAAILHSPAFQIICVGAYLYNLTYMVQASQLVLILNEKGITPAAVSWILSIYGIGVIVGRVASGIAFDRFAPHMVVAIALAPPVVGLFMLASGVHSPTLLAAAVSTLGLSMGAETNILPYLVMRYFRVEIFSTVLSLVGSAMAIGSVSSSLILSLTLKLSGGFAMFLALSAVTTTIGSGVFLMLGRPSIRGTVT